MEGVILILGGQNDRQGRLSLMTQSRLIKALRLAKRYPKHRLMVTGTFGWNFNTTNQPHWYYLKKWLLENGIRSQRILPGVSSNNTARDLKLAKRFLASRGINRIIIVTSDFHLPRVRLLCHFIFDEHYVIRFEASRIHFGYVRRLIYVAHEKLRIALIHLTHRV